MTQAVRIYAGAGLLYIGPVLAGIGGADAVWIWPFAGIFTVWILLARPAFRPSRRSGTGDWVRLALAAGVQSVLVALCLGVGWALHWVGLALPVEPGWALVVSALALPFAKPVDPRMNAVLGEALKAVQGQATALSDPDADALAETLRKGPYDTTPGDLARMADSPTVWAELADKAGQAPEWRRTRLLWLGHEATERAPLDPAAVAPVLLAGLKDPDPGIAEAAAWTSVEWAEAEPRFAPHRPAVARAAQARLAAGARGTLRDALKAARAAARG
ncbi:hypothetical protein DXV76_08730 [Rhodobacteraceae bacterium CCMM004]|nr:hypothetical protein DXV76_08730 [Rhodobacteraceae bacterium CCMM004]